MDVETTVSVTTAELDRRVREAAFALLARNRQREAATNAPGWAHLNAEGQQAKLDEIDAPMLEAERRAREAAEVAHATAETLERFGEAPAQLADREMERATNLAVFIREDVEADRDGEATAVAIGDAIAEGDRARVFCLARYARKRIAAEHAAGRSAWGPSSLLDALKRADAMMADPNRARARAEAVALRQKAREARQAIHEARHEEHQVVATAHVRGKLAYSF